MDRLIAVFEEVVGPPLEKQDTGSIGNLGSDVFDHALRMRLGGILALQDRLTSMSAMVATGSRREVIAVVIRRGVETNGEGGVAGTGTEAAGVTELATNLCRAATYRDKVQPWRWYDRFAE